MTVTFRPALRSMFAMLDWDLVITSGIAERSLDPGRW